ncbi:hypothetical protein HGR_09204 [Hylemonella gracilis ATCC 19624]|uniref:Uncharacterized protein n=1 Tax=Hylemonella gracilis ATCC 19624 TaxID=887062 RepID=F3KTR0_9BURK|nr:hypothetical protein HGR_09204 [Hylemonella gracilis ATCC 19624]
MVTLVASFAGAWAAFRLQAHEKNNELIRHNVGAGNRAIFDVYALWNVLEQFRKEVLEPSRGRPDAWLNLAAHPAAPVAVDRFDASALQFLLEEGHASVFASLMLEERRFHLAIDLIRSRSELVLDTVFPKMATAGFNVMQPQNETEVEQAIGLDVCHKLRQITAAIFQNVDEDLTSLRQLYVDLRTAMQALYPGRKFVQVDFDRKPEDAGGAAAV